VWVAWTTFWDAGLYGDNVEQFVWVHSMQWGYHKHPPMPTWLLGAAMQLVGPHSWLTNALAAICFAITGALTWLIARDLLGEKVANTALVLWTMQQCFSLSAQIYNHNTVLVMFMAAAVYASLCARKATGVQQFISWAVAGIFAGCAMLSKYQAALPLFSLLVVVCISLQLPRRTLFAGLAAASAGFAVVFTPHFYWAVSHDFPTLRYASAAIESGGMAQRAAWVATFFINQIRMILPLLMAVGLSMVICKNRQLPVTLNNLEPRPAHHVKVWLWGLVWAPVIILIVASLISGSQLRNHWGVQLFQFLPLWVAWQWRHSDVLKVSNLLPIALVVHTIGLGYYAIKQSDPNAAQAERRADSAYPARRMANAAHAHWKAQTNCPLKIIQGDFEAGLVSAFTPGFPMVYTGPVATPWVTPEQLAQHGALYVLESNTPVPADAKAGKKWLLAAGDVALPARAEKGKYVQFAVRLPLAVCQ